MKSYMRLACIFAVMYEEKNITAFQISEDIFPEIDEEYREFYYKTNRDVLDVKNTFQTIFFVGSSKVYGSIANDCKEFAEEDQEPFFNEHKWHHDHRHLDMYLRKRKEINFSIDYYDKKLWGS